MNIKFDKIDRRSDKANNRYNTVDKLEEKVQRLDTKVDLLNQDMTSKFEIDEERILR